MSNKSNDKLTINGQYKIIEDKEKGYGSFSKVYLAEDIKNKKNYAIKIFKDSTSFFETEISTLQKVSSRNNPYIVNLIDFGENIFQIGKNVENKKYAVLEYASNGELYNFIKKTETGLKERYAKFIFRKILKGVQAIHNLGICHRDLKLENILLDNCYNPKICDFGFATEIKGKDGSGKLYEFLGTENYAAPEMFINKPYNGIKIDIFSLGVILLKLVTAKNGFLRANKEDQYNASIL